MLSDVVHVHEPLLKFPIGSTKEWILMGVGALREEMKAEEMEKLSRRVGRERAVAREELDEDMDDFRCLASVIVQTGDNFRYQKPSHTIHNTPTIHTFPYRNPSTLRPLLRQLQMPLHDTLKDALASTLDNIPMARDNPVKIPLMNLTHTPTESCAVSFANPIPNRPLLPVSTRARQHAEDLGQDPARRADPRLAVLLRRRVVEHEVSLDEGAGGLVVEDDFLVGVRGDVLPLEFAVEVRVDGAHGVGFAEDVCEGDVLVVLGLALLGEAFGAEDLRVGVGGVPGTEEDVVLER